MSLTLFRPPAASEVEPGAVRSAQLTEMMVVGGRRGEKTVAAAQAAQPRKGWLRFLLACHGDRPATLARRPRKMRALGCVRCVRDFGQHSQRIMFFGESAAECVSVTVFLFGDFFVFANACGIRTSFVRAAGFFGFVRWVRMGALLCTSLHALYAPLYAHVWRSRSCAAVSLIVLSLSLALGSLCLAWFNRGRSEKKLKKHTQVSHTPAAAPAAAAAAPPLHCRRPSPGLLQEGST